MTKVNEHNYNYTGKNSKGVAVSGHIHAKDLAHAKATLKIQGITDINLSIQKSSNPASYKVKPSEIATFARQLATMQHAGLPIIRSLDVIIQGAENPATISLIKAIKHHVESGLTLSDALSMYPNSFDDLFCNLIRAGENSGTLQVMLDRIAIYKERTESLKKKLKKAMYYPIIITIVSIAVAVVLLVKVVPTFKDLFQGFGAQLPAFTQIILHISDAVQKHGVKILAIAAVIIVAFMKMYKKNKSVRGIIQRLLLTLPIFGGLINKASVARFARTLSTTFAAGVPLTESLGAVAKTSGNIVYHDAIINMRDAVISGQSISKSMSATNIFPNMVVQMIAVGEESGSLENMLTKVANIYEEEVELAVDGLSTLLEPLIMVVLGGMVGSLVIAMYLPIFKMGSVV